MMKCKFCKEIKSKTEFIKINGFFQHVCKECYFLDEQKELREKHEIFRQKRLADHRIFKSKYRKKHPDFALWKSAQQRAKRYNLPFTIQVSDIIIPEYCPVLGIKLKQAKGRMNDFSPTLDRIKPEMGYVPGNICVMSNKANRLKGDGSIEEHEKIISFLKKKINVYFS